MVAVLFSLVAEFVLNFVFVILSVIRNVLLADNSFVNVRLCTFSAVVNGNEGAAPVADEVTDATVQAALEGLLGQYVYVGVLVVLAVGAGVTLGYLAGRFLGQLQLDTRLSIPSQAEAEAGFRAVERARLESAIEEERLSAVVRDATQDAATNRLLRGELDIADTICTVSRGVNVETRIDIFARLVRELFESTNALFVGTCLGLVCTAVCCALLVSAGFGRGGNFLIIRRSVLVVASAVLSYTATLSVAVVLTLFGIRLDANAVTSLPLLTQCGYFGGGVLLGVTTAFAVVVVLALRGYDTPARIARAQRLEERARRTGRFY